MIWVDLLLVVVFLRLLSFGSSLICLDFTRNHVELHLLMRNRDYEKIHVPWIRIRTTFKEGNGSSHSSEPPKHDSLHPSYPTKHARAMGAVQPQLATHRLR